MEHVVFRLFPIGMCAHCSVLCTLCVFRLKETPQNVRCQMDYD